MISLGPAPSASTLETRVRMQRVRRRDTPIEKRLRKLLHARGYRYRVDARPLNSLRRKADIVFVSARLAIFVDGCFWHACPDHGSTPLANRGWWQEKLDTNKARDADTDQRLSAAGWAVLRFWEHEDPGHIADVVSVALERHVACLGVGK